MAERVGDLQALAVRVVEAGLRAGADGVFAWATASRSASCDVRDGELEALEDNRSRGISLRLYVDGRYFVGATSDVRPELLEAFIRDSVALVRLVPPDPFRGLPEPSLFSNRADRQLELYDATIEDIAVEERIARAEALSSTLANVPELLTATASVTHGTVASAGCSSNGFEGSSVESWISTGVSVTLRDGERKRARGSMGASASHVDDLPTERSVATQALHNARARLGATRVPSTVATMVVDPRVGGRLIRLLLGPSFGGAVQQKRSFWAGRLGERLVADRLRVSDEPWLPRRSGSTLFDGEGIASKPRQVIADGALQGYFLDTYFARKLAMAPNGGSMSNIVVAKGQGDLASILADVHSGFYVTGWLGGNSDPTTGDFSLGIEGHTIERGAIATPISEMNITGNLLGLFANLIAVGEDYWPYGRIVRPTMAFANVGFGGR
jgi:PmbA protein